MRHAERMRESLEHVRCKTCGGSGYLYLESQTVSCHDCHGTGKARCRARRKT